MAIPTEALNAEDRLIAGENAMRKRRNRDKKRWNYYKGVHELPFAPEGVNEEYMQIREDSPLPLIRLAVKTPVQRLKCGGVRLNGSEEVDDEAWRIWKANNLRSRQRTVYTHALTYGRGIVSVWPDEDDPMTPIVRPENPANVHVEPDPEDPYRPLWALKRVEHVEKDAFGRPVTISEAYVYEDDFVWKFRANGPGAGWELEDVLDNPLGRVPFVVFAPELDPDGETYSVVDPLIPMQRAIDSMRFDLLLAAQFAAYRQRIITGYDPILRDENGEPVFRENEDGTPMLDSQGQPIPVIADPGRVGVERFLVFPGDATNVFDLDESNLQNYVKGLEMLVATFASTAQVPPQYLIGDFKNVSGDLMVATEATLRSLVSDLQISFDEGWEDVYQLIYIARKEEPPKRVESVWDDAEPKSLQQIASAASQMVPNGAPLRMFLEMMPGSNPQQVKRWMEMSEKERERALALWPSGEFGPKPPTGTAGDDDDTTA